jgi:transposase-like protein
MDLMALMAHFQSDEKCRAYLVALRWPQGVRCLKCASSRISYISTRRQFECDACEYQFSVTAGTIFHDSHLPLSKWLAAVYLMSESRKGISANQLKRTLAVSYKTAWYLCHRIRAAVKDADERMLTGTVEVDETYIGGKARGMGRGYRGNKAMVLAAIQRSGAVRLAVDRHADRPTLHGFIRKNVSDTATRIMTDEWAPYEGIADGNTTHETVNHRAEEWVRGDVHTNTVEGVFSLFKRSIIGAYHQVSHKHLGAYLDEFEFRFNNRDNKYLFRDTLRKLLGAETLPYRKLVTTQMW